MSIVDHFSGVRTVFTLYLKLLHLTENIKTDELYHKSANVDATKSAQSFSTLMDGEQKATTFITTRAFEKLNGDVNINLDLGTFVEGFGLPDGATQNNDLVAHSNNHMHYLEKHVHVNEILNTKTETLSSANDVPIHQNVANNIQNNSLISTESIQNNITVLQTVTENVTGSNQTINIFGGSQQVLPDKLKQEYFQSENATFESTQRATSSDILDPNEHNLNPVLEQQHNEKYQNAAVLPDGFLSNDEMQSLYGSNMYENYDISSQGDGFGGFYNAPIASEPEEGTHHGGIKSDDAFVYANNKGGFSAIGSFNSVKVPLH
ncbi:hypothetical protein DPMN_004471 [Dreissena polymorpha]|uniref:Uncharacterized protein n=1 Tax=Dreissena polymorpha TaxID=45954 RepID=A0A9D4MRM4_DREPO|nr:hypothetical protein DPMN_004471 [Dreissena polymorpha]